VEQPNGSTDIDQEYPIWKNQKFTNQDNRERHVDGVAAVGKNTSRYKPIGTVLVNADTKALPERNQAPQKQQ
jgi:hypothetical protein